MLDQLIVLFQQEYHLAGDDLVKGFDRACSNWRWAVRIPRPRALERQINALLEQVAVLCLYQNPVAPLLLRYCLNGATYTTSVGEILNIEDGAVVCLVPQVTLAVELNDLLFGNSSTLRETFPFTNGRFLFMGDTTHACMGRQIALFEIREALKLLLSLPAVRPAAPLGWRLSAPRHACRPSTGKKVDTLSQGILIQWQMA